jgi:hypothetical protein
MVFSLPLVRLVRGFAPAPIACILRRDASALTGPGNCLGLLASKSSPTAVRGQYYGVAAAIGKVGAFVGTWGKFRTKYASSSS